MDIDPLELTEDGEDSKRDKAKSRLNSMVAITIALLATFMGICKVKDDNIGQAMQQAQAKSLDAWSTFHAKSTESKLLDAAASEIEIVAASNPAAAGPVKRFRSKQAEELKEKDEWEKTAKDAQEDYDRLNYRDDQFDLSDTLLAMAISLLAVTSLTGKRWLYWIALIPTALGLLMGLAGLLSLKIHPDTITNLLSLLTGLR
jgi:ribosomal protein L12E/L44/L45/RPP1/RPP2